MFPSRRGSDAGAEAVEGIDTKGRCSNSISFLDCLAAVNSSTAATARIGSPCTEVP